MTKQLLKNEVNLAVLDTDQDLDGKLAWNIARLIADADSDVRLAKGKFWKNCKHGTKEKICGHFGWNIGSMEDYAMYAREIPAIAGISLALAQCKSSWALKDERPALMEKAVKKNWTSVRVTEEAKKIKEKREGSKNERTIIEKLTEGFLKTCIRIRVGLMRT